MHRDVHQKNNFKKLGMTPARLSGIFVGCARNWLHNYTLRNLTLWDLGKFVSLASAIGLLGLLVAHPVAVTHEAAMKFVRKILHIIRIFICTHFELVIVSANLTSDTTFQIPAEVFLCEWIICANSTGVLQCQDLRFHMQRSTRCTHQTA